MGYAWVAVLHYWLQLSYTATLLIATGMPAVWLLVVHALMQLSKPGSKTGAQYTQVPSCTGESQHTYGTQNNTSTGPVHCDGLWGRGLNGL